MELNKDASGLEDEFVPGTPSGALVCRYHPLVSGPHINLLSETIVDADGAARLAATMNSITDEQLIPHSCGGQQRSRTRVTIVVFQRSGRSDVTTWMSDSTTPAETALGCVRDLSNGVRSAPNTPAAVAAALDRISPSAPIICEDGNPPDTAGDCPF